MGSLFIWRGVICGALWCLVVLCGVLVTLWCALLSIISYTFIGSFQFFYYFYLNLVSQIVKQVLLKRFYKTHFQNIKTLIPKTT
jgi:hypothetical protein